jgi:uncharacterized membrane protein YphA (DoxX/SURF4 family)
MDSTMSRGVRRAQARSWALSIAQAATGAYFFVAGLLKLAGVAMMVHAFERWGMGAPVRLAVGAVELACGIAVIFPRSARVAAWTLLGLTSLSALVHVAKLDAPIELLEPLLLGSVLTVVANAASQKDFGEERATGSGSGPPIELVEQEQDGGRLLSRVPRRRRR